MSLIGKWQKQAIFTVITSVLITFFQLPNASAAVTFGSPVEVNTTGLSTFNFTSMQASRDGSILIASYGKSYLLRSTDSGTTWSSINSLGIKTIVSVAINDSATVIAAAESTGSVWVSIDSGISWTQQTNGISTNSSWNTLDMNSSGSVIVASNQSASVYVSTNYGGLWTSRSASTATTIRGVAVSASGDKMGLYSSGDSYVYLSSDTGTTWVKQSTAGVGSGAWTGLWMSRDGQRLLWGKSNGAGYTHLGVTQNFGSTWETITSGTTSIIGATANDDLSSIAIAPNGASVYYSSNSGSTWAATNIGGSLNSMFINSASTRWVFMTNGVGIYTSDGPPTSFTYRPVNLGLAVWGRSSTSSDGTVIVAAAINGEINVSRDGGATWSGVSSLGRNYNWGCVAVSGDGNVIYVGGGAMRVYKSTDKGITWSPLSGGTLPASNISTLGCATNSNGSRVALSYSGVGLLLSTNSGTSFSTIFGNAACFKVASYEFNSVTMTSDGAKLAVTCNSANVPIYVSSNYGSMWETTTATTTRFFKEIKSSADGSLLVATVGDTTAPFISRNWGSTWSNATGISTSYGTALSINSDGNLLVIGQTGSSGVLYYSLNKGVSFSQIAGMPSGNFGFAALNADATNLLVGIEGRPINRLSVSLVYLRAAFSGVTLNVSNVAFRSPVTLTATVSTAGADGRVTFQEAGKNIAGCVKVPTSSLVASCIWKPTKRGSSSLTAIIYPTDTSFLTGSTTLQVIVGNRTGNR